MQQQRFKDALWFAKRDKVKVHLGGAGGIGSWVAYFLSKIGYAFNIYDFDNVEYHNLGGQLFTVDSIGKPKVEAVFDIINNYNLDAASQDNQYFNSSIEELDVNNMNLFSHAVHNNINIFVSAFDNMKARKIFFNKYEECNEKLKLEYERLNSSSYPYGNIEKCFFIDGRLLMEQMRIFCVNNEKHRKQYKEEFLFSDDEVEDLPCSMKQTSHSAAMIATHMIGFINNYISNVLTLEENCFTVPFSWEYIIPTNTTIS